MLAVGVNDFAKVSAIGAKLGQQRSPTPNTMLRRRRISVPTVGAKHCLSPLAFSYALNCAHKCEQNYTQN